MNNTIIYALDFDGVICDNGLESCWRNMERHRPKAVPQTMIDRFRLVRPIIETGYETILTIRLLYLEKTIKAFYPTFRTPIHSFELLFTFYLSMS
jgi:hypothetical protein